MKLSPMLCASAVTVAAFLLTANGAFALTMKECEKDCSDGVCSSNDGGVTAFCYRKLKPMAPTKGDPTTKPIAGTAPKPMDKAAPNKGNPTTKTGSSDVKDIDIIVRKKPGGSNMACMYDKKPCSQNVVRQVAEELSKTGISISLAAPDGALRCTTRDGKDCTDAHFVQVQTAGRAVQQKGISGN